MQRVRFICMCGISRVVNGNHSLKCNVIRGHLGVQASRTWSSKEDKKELPHSRIHRYGERLFPQPKPELTSVEEVKEVDWSVVERLLPRKTVPDPPEHESYPTPSGWVPPKAESASLPYSVRRTRFHNFPVYHEVFDGGSRKMTVIQHIEGDIWVFEAELRKFLTDKLQEEVYTQVDEVTTKVRVRGNCSEHVSEFLLSKGL